MARRGRAVKLDAADLIELRPLIVETARAVLDELRANEFLRGERLGFTEPEAAALLGLARHVLRDCRLRGEIVGRHAGRKILYSRTELLRFLNAER
jgi:hypothetical protein